MAWTQGYRHKAKLVFKLRITHYESRHHALRITDYVVKLRLQRRLSHRRLTHDE